MNSNNDKPPPKSNFGQRFSYLIHLLRGHGKLDLAKEFAAIVGLSESRVTEYKSREEAPMADVCLSVAQRAGVDVGWLAFGEDSQAPKPEGFDVWLGNYIERTPEAPVKRERARVDRGTIVAGRGAKPRPGEKKRA